MNRYQAIVEIVKAVPPDRRLWPALIAIVLIGLSLTALAAVILAVTR